MVTRQHGDHLEMYRYIESLCRASGTNIVLQVSYTSKTNKRTNKLIEKEMRSDLVTRGGGGGELDENNEKILQISSYKIGIPCTS